MSAPKNPGTVGARHWLGAVAGGVAAWLLILVLSSLYSVATGYGPLGPYQGTGSVLGFAGNAGLALGFVIDLLIPVVVGLVFVAALALLSRFPLRPLAFETGALATLDGALVGLVVWAVFYVPVIYSLSHPTFAAFVQPLLFALGEHVAFGAVLGIVIFAVGGPVAFGRTPRADGVGAAR